MNLILDKLKILEIQIRTTKLSANQLIDIRERLSHMLDIVGHLADEMVKKQTEGLA